MDDSRTGTSLNGQDTLIVTIVEDTANSEEKMKSNNDLKMTDDDLNFDLSSSTNIENSSFTDILQCGECGQSFQNVIEFLTHKSTHATTAQAVGCALCGQSYNKQSFLRDHYKKKHYVKFIKSDSPVKINRKHIINNPVSDINSQTIDQQYQVEEKSPAIVNDNQALPDSSMTDKLNTVHVVITKTDDQLGDMNIFDNDSLMEPNAPLPENSNSQELSINEEEKIIPIENAELNVEKPILENCIENSTLTETETATKSQTSKLLKNNPTEEIDFHFILTNNTINGKKFPYGKHGFKCLHCDFVTSWRTSLCKHMSVEHTDIMAIHQFIEIKSPELDSSQNLLRMSEYLANSQRSKELKVKKSRGVESQDKPGHYPCLQCEKVFNRLRYLRKHVDIHKTENKYLCDECGKAFKTKNYLSAHRRTHKTRLFRCTQCSFTSNVNSLIHSHRQLHSEGSVLCDVCGQAYLDNSTLKKHKRVHDMNRPFACTFQGCTWRFNKEALCQAHIKSHTTIGQFICHVCNYSFRHKHHLQRHLSRIHGVTNSKSDDVKKEGVDSVSNDADPDSNTVNFVIDSEISPDQLESAIQQGNLVISSTDVEGNCTVNYVTYHTLLDQDTTVEGDAQTIVIPHSDCNQIIFQQ
ncbi:zinc finger protein 91 [Patella vulgata]|uniref:zinc finger protein 91 n=1 Tax=Patella vulgata TaxID=6465 RepID=UPI00218019EB|nr:zinc finger protein 91 [Patella vulgata]